MQRVQVVRRLKQLVKTGEELVAQEYFVEEHEIVHMTTSRWIFPREKWYEKVPAHYTLPEELLPPYAQWKLSCLNLLRMSMGTRSQFYHKFEDSERIAFQVAVLKSALDEFETGFVRPVITADIFNNVLDRAEELLSKGYHNAAAIVGRVVLEQALRKIADRHSVPGAKVSILNQQLWKEGIYEKPMWRQVQVWIDIGNEAAHGNWDKYDVDQVEDMLKGVRLFLETVA